MYVLYELQTILLVSQKDMDLMPGLESGPQYDSHVESHVHPQDGPTISYRYLHPFGLIVEVSGAPLGADAATPPARCHPMSRSS